MKYIYFRELVENLCSMDSVSVLSSIYHEKGVYREYAISIAAYVIRIAYLEFGTHNIPLKFHAVKEGKEPVLLDSVQQLMDTVSISLHSCDKRKSPYTTNTPNFLFSTATKN